MEHDKHRQNGGIPVSDRRSQHIVYTHFTMKREHRGLVSPGAMVPSARPTGNYLGATVMPRENIDGMLEASRRTQGHMTRIRQ